jgi:N-acetyl-gamma-glutamylphosphate reductase
MIRAAVVGASGYAGAELVRILSGHSRYPCPSLRPGNMQEPLTTAFIRPSADSSA